MSRPKRLTDQLLQSAGVRLMLHAQCVDARLSNGRVCGAVLATKAGGVPEFVHDGQDGLLLPPGDAEALAECLDRLLDDPVERGRLAAGALQAAQRFALQQHADAMMVAFDMATGESCA